MEFTQTVSVFDCGVLNFLSIRSLKVLQTPQQHLMKTPWITCIPYIPFHVYNSGQNVYHYDLILGNANPVSLTNSLMYRQSTDCYTSLLTFLFNFYDCEDISVTSLWNNSSWHPLTGWRFIYSSDEQRLGQCSTNPLWDQSLSLEPRNAQPFFVSTDSSFCAHLLLLS